MHITRIRVAQPPTPGSPPDWRTSLGQILVAIETDTGLTGYGVGGGGPAGRAVIDLVLAPMLIGQDPAPVELLWEQMYQTTLPYGRKGLAIMALSGVDLALWDLRGKVAVRPLVELLGGSVDATLPCYLTIKDDPQRFVAEGFRHGKLGVPAIQSSADRDGVIDQVRRARELLDEIRRRSGDGDRPQLELDYLKRLLERF